MSESGDTVDAINHMMATVIPALGKMGVKAVEARRGFAASSVPIEGNSNHFGAMYAGILFSVAEVLGGVIATSTFDSSKYFPLVKDLQISFRRPATTDVRAEVSLDDATIDKATADAKENGKAEFFLDAVVTDANGVTVATTHGTYQLRVLPS
ncbi:PaaI family thioesterase [Antrihabitans cavernicola]|uniref:PaaI family thioesterase n=1 Tax=Antrihabitans cavernicola TaxID=2495913 RepID=A0A5A7SFE2_9NOCA|nr:PaaI family thioesterase [Spelaeibacter cavernicola]KAA0024848.1 PaaI family thioesterase [Spelaeibacter cavernicola]